jgi:hypothetical protein
VFILLGVIVKEEEILLKASLIQEILMDLMNMSFPNLMVVVFLYGMTQQLNLKMKRTLLFL